MLPSRRVLSRIFCSVAVVLVLFFTGLAFAQTQHAAAGVTSEEDQAAIQKQLIELLRLSPTLTTVVEHDPSLLSNQEYVSRNNPRLAQYLASHPEVVRNPDFYLFTRLPQTEGQPDQALERAVWPELQHVERERPGYEVLLDQGGPFIALVVITGAILWLTRLFLQNRRWHRMLRMQMDVHGKLIDRLGSGQETLAYMGSEAGRHFLEAAPLPVNFDGEQSNSGAISRILTPLQTGLVLVLLGIGFFLLRHTQREMEIPMLVLGTVTLMPGIGFILSAVITWALAGRLGLMPTGTEESATAYSSFPPKERQ